VSFVRLAVLGAPLAALCHCVTNGQALCWILEFCFTGSQVEKKKKKRWLWPLGVMATGITGAAVVVLRGCWHRKMSWPVSSQNHSYQVCLGCGIKRLFDEHNFRAYGPYSYDLTRLIAWQKVQEAKPHDVPRAVGKHRSAS